MTTELQRVTDEALARQTQAGSLAAFEELVYRYEKRIFGFVAHFQGRGVDAREITQDTFVKAFQAIASYDPSQAFGAWLFTIAHRTGIDRCRTAPPASDGPVPEQLDTDDPSELLARREDRQDLWRLARRRLPQLQYQALWLRYVEDMDLAGVARVLRKTQTHVKVLLFRARQTLARDLGATQEPSGSPRPSRACPHSPATPTALTPKPVVSPRTRGQSGLWTPIPKGQS